MRLTLPSTPALRSQVPLVTQEHPEALWLASLPRRLSRSRDNFTSLAPLVIVVKGVVLL
jgi:hypothetical protein